MNKGVEILLKRMESHPQEFEEDWEGSPYETRKTIRWYGILRAVEARAMQLRQHETDRPNSARVYELRPLPFLSDEEVLMIYDKWQGLQGPAFTRHVMRQLLDEEKEPPINAAAATGNTTTVVSAANTPFATGVLGSVTSRWKNMYFTAETEAEDGKEEV